MLGNIGSHMDIKEKTIFNPIFMKQVFAIRYYNGEHYDALWEGILEGEGVFDTKEMAEDRIIEMKAAYAKQVRDEEWDSYPDQTWTVVPINYHTKS